MRKTYVSRGRLLSLIEQVYAAAEDGGLWQPLVASIADAVDATGATLLSHDLAAVGAAFSANLDPEALRLYNDHYNHVDTWAIAGAARARSAGYRAVIDDELVPRSDFLKTEFCAFVQRYDISSMMHANLRLDAVGTSGISLYRRRADPPFGAAETRFLDALSPHLRRALRMHERFARAAREQDLVLDGLNALRSGVLFVTGDARVIHANRAAQDMLGARDGLFLDGGRLTGTVPAITSSIRQLCADCAATTRGDGTGPGGPVALPRPSGRRDLQLLVCPVKRDEPFGLRDDRIAAVAFVTDPLTKNGFQIRRSCKPSMG
jgi:hypothetical protein